MDEEEHSARVQEEEENMVSFVEYQQQYISQLMKNSDVTDEDDWAKESEESKEVEDVGNNEEIEEEPKSPSQIDVSLFNIDTPTPKRNECCRSGKAHGGFYLRVGGVHKQRTPTKRTIKLRKMLSPSRRP